MTSEQRGKRGRSAAQQAAREAAKDKAIAYIKQCVDQRGYPPSTGELCQHLGYKSTASVHQLLADLMREGRITREPHQPRSIRILQEPHE